MPNHTEPDNQFSATGDVMRVETLQGPALGIYKGSARFMIQDAMSGQITQDWRPGMVVYVPTLGDCMMWPSHLLDPAPVCPVCDSDVWHWTGDNPLFPDAILCAACVPPQISRHDIVAAAEEVADLLVNKDARFAIYRDTLTDWSDDPWPVVQKRVFEMWIQLIVE